jgi:hypothetical protein
MNTLPSTTAMHVQLEFDFMADMAPHLSPAAAAREFAAMRRSVGGERSDRRGPIDERSS